MKQYKINQFTSQEFDSIEYDWDNHEDEILIIEKDNAYCMDITANGKRIVPILRKIESSMTEAGLAGDNGIFAGWFGEWANVLTDRSSRKNFIWSYSGLSDIERNCWSYSWGIEQIDDDLWYIFLNIAKPHDEIKEEAKEANEETEETIKETKEENRMKKYFKVTFQHSENIFCANIAHAETIEDVECEYSKYAWKSIKEAQPWDVDEAKMNGIPIIEIEHIKENTSSAPSADSEAQEATNNETKSEKEEQTMKKPSFTIKCIQFHHDENFKMIGDPIYREFAGSTLKEAKAAWKAARDNNDVVKFSPLTIYDIINSEEE